MTLQTILHALSVVFPPPIALILIGWAIKIFFPEAWAYIEKGHPALAKSVYWQRFKQIVKTEVDAADQTVVNDAKGSNAWTPALAAKVKTDVFTGVMSHLGADLKEFLTGEVGDVGAFVGKAIEAQVAENRNTVQAKVAAGVNPTSPSASGSVTQQSA